MKMQILCFLVEKFNLILLCDTNEVYSFFILNNKYHVLDKQFMTELTVSDLGD